MGFGSLRWLLAGCWSGDLDPPPPLFFCSCVGRLVCSAVVGVALVAAGAGVDSSVDADGMPVVLHGCRCRRWCGPADGVGRPSLHRLRAGELLVPQIQMVIFSF